MEREGRLQGLFPKRNLKNQEPNSKNQVDLFAGTEFLVLGIWFLGFGSWNFTRMIAWFTSHLRSWRRISLDWASRSLRWKKEAPSESMSTSWMATLSRTSPWGRQQSKDCGP